MALRSSHQRVAEEPAWQESLDQALAELRLAALHKSRALAAIKQAVDLGASWSDVGSFLRDRHLRVPKQR